MICRKIDIWEGLKYHGESDDGFRPYINTYIHERNKKRGAVLICPGGAYWHTSPREAEPIALKFVSAGYHSFVLHYSVAPRKHPQLLHDLSRAMCIIRQNSDKWNVETESIAVCGFSAGGHLAASLGVHWNKDFAYDQDGIIQGMNKPNALILCYPVITSGEYKHAGSFVNLLGENPGIMLTELMSLEKQVGPHTPVTFLWHTFEDSAVHIENSILFAKALKKNNIPFEYHVYPYGCHGLSLATEETDENGLCVNLHASSWMDLCVKWLDMEFTKMNIM